MASRKTSMAGRRGRHRHGRDHLARRRQGRQLGQADRRANPASAASRASPPTASRHASPARSISAGRAVLLADAGERMAEHRRRGGDRANPASARKANFPGRCSSRLPPIEIEWPQREEIAAASGANDTIGYDDLLRAARPAAFTTITSASCSARSPITSPTDSAPRARRSRCRPPAPRARRAIQLGVEAIRRGETDAALCIGTDGSVNPEALIRFSLLSALSTANDPPQGAAKPFSKNRDGFVMAEGAGALVLESSSRAKARGAKILGVLAGCGEMADRSTAPAPAPTASRSSAASATPSPTPASTPDDIDYINAARHRHAGERQDGMPRRARPCSASAPRAIPISSNKSMIGHTLSAAGAVEAVFTLLTLEHQRIPPTINYDVPDPAIPLDVVPNVARDAKVRHAHVELLRLRRPERVAGAWRASRP